MYRIELRVYEVRSPQDQRLAANVALATAANRRMAQIVVDNIVIEWNPSQIKNAKIARPS